MFQVKGWRRFGDCNQPLVQRRTGIGVPRQRL
jgi:hypothetical protein